MKKLKLCNIETLSEDDEIHKKFLVVRRESDEDTQLNKKVKYTKILKEETDFLEN